MPSSSEERPTMSRMVALPAKLLMASDRRGCEQLKDLINRGDAMTMAAVFTISADNEEDSMPAHMFMDPRLLMAARDGDCAMLENLLMIHQEQQTPEEDHFIIQIPDEASRVHNVLGEGTNNHPDDSAGHEGPTVMQAEDHPLANRTDAIQTTVDAAEDANRTDAIQTTVDAAEEGTHHPAISLLNGVTFDTEEDSALHVVATAGDSVQYLKCAEMIYDKAKDLLSAANKNGDTPLHCAATAGNLNMVSRLMELAARESVIQLLRKKNKVGETVLHSAIRSGNIKMVNKILSQDLELADVPNGNTSPLYLAISLRRLDIAEELFKLCSKLSYTGPDGQNILHIAIFQHNAIRRLLEWCRLRNLPIVPLTNQADIYGSTPLHLAASADIWHRSFSLLFMEFMTAHFGFPFCILRHMKREGPTTLLIEANTASLYQPDKRGSYPIHVAAATGSVKSVVIILERSPSCATLRDGQGRTFLHVAVNNKKWAIVAFACQSPQFEPVLNMQDSKGNSALCLAVEAGDQWIFNCLFQNHRVLLDLSNKEELTACDIARLKIPGPFYYQSNPRSVILRALQFAKAAVNDSRLDHTLGKDTRKIDEDKESEKLTNASQVMGIVSVLVATVTFAAAFTLPGGYRADDHADAGTPTLAGSYAFDAFVISIALAFICSLLSTIGLIYSGFASVDYSIRGRFSDRSKVFLHSSVRSLAVAFAIAIYLVMSPVALKTAIAVCVIICVGLLFQNFEIRQHIILANTIRIRFGLWEAMGCSILDIVLQNILSLVLIFTLPLFLKIH